jgi:replicative DNA helicase
MAKLAARKDLKTDSLKIPPHSIEAEQSVLGGVMLDNNAWEKVAESVNEEDFYRWDHKIIFRAMRRLMDNHKPLDVITLSETLAELNQLDEAGGHAYLIDLARNTPSASNVAAYAEIVRERSVLRLLITSANEIGDSAFNPEGRASAELVDEAERRIFAIAERGTKTGGPMPVKSFLARAVKKIDELFHAKSAITGLSTGYADLDELTAGFQRSDLIIVAARPSMGKTTFAMNIAENIAILEGKPVLVFSLEMPGDAITTRLLASLGRINQTRLRTGQLQEEDWPRIGSAISLLTEKAHIYIDDTPGISPTELRSRARRVKREAGDLGLIVVDYLQLMQVPGNKENRTAEISEISRSLKLLAKELNTPIVALSQLNRGLENRPNNKRPIMSDLRESGAIEQDADIIAFVYRDEVYNPDTPEKGVAEIIIAKQRNGPIGTVRLAFLGEFCRFENLSHYQGGQ